VADPESGFHVVKDTNDSEDPQESTAPLDTAEVTKAKARHKALFDAIAARHRAAAAGDIIANRETIVSGYYGKQWFWWGRMTW